MLRIVSRDEYRSHKEECLRRYEEAGLSPAECMSDVCSAQTRWAQSDGYADGVMVGGIALTIAGLICKWLAHKELKQYNREINAKVRNAMSVKPLTDFKVPGSEDDDREENNDLYEGKRRAARIE